MSVAEIQRSEDKRNCINFRYWCDAQFVRIQFNDTTEALPCWVEMQGTLTETLTQFLVNQQIAMASMPISVVMKSRKQPYNCVYFTPTPTHIHYGNQYYGIAHKQSKVERGFYEKKREEYTLSEWLENVFIVPSTTKNFTHYFYLLDKRSSHGRSRWGVAFNENAIAKLESEPEQCRYLLQRYYDEPFSHCHHVKSLSGL